MQAMQQHLCNHARSRSLWATYNTGWSNTVYLMHKFCWQSRKNITNDLSAIEGSYTRRVLFKKYSSKYWLCLITSNTVNLTKYNTVSTSRAVEDNNFNKSVHFG